MAKYDRKSATIEIFVHKAGMLSAMGHDLRLIVERFSIELDGAPATIRARAEADSIRVAAAQVEGRDDPSALSARDRQQIEENLAKDVLHVRRYPDIRFSSTAVVMDGASPSVTGRLELHGTAKSITVQPRREGSDWVVELRLLQPDWGISPYSAFMGALRIKPEVLVRVRVPAAS